MLETIECPYCKQSDQILDDGYYVQCIRCKRTIRESDFWSQRAIFDRTENSTTVTNEK